jgi:tectonin beta-propeller repeat-containing protein 1
MITNKSKFILSKLPCSLFSWSSNWQIDFSTPNGVDKNGWQYAFDFPMR